MSAVYERAKDLLAQAHAALQRGETLPALRFAEEAEAIDGNLAGLRLVRARCLGAMGRLTEALAAIDAELKEHPANAEAIQIRGLIVQKMDELKQRAAEPRRWETFLNNDFIARLEDAAHRYAYRGHAMIKNPFDFALYPLLLWNAKPRTIFEIGSYNGASALWFADLLTTYGIDGHVHSLDIVKVTAIADPRITYHEGSGREPGATFTEELLASCPRPWLVIEDADHSDETSTAVLNFFREKMAVGEYIVIEDGLSTQGPRDAIAKFMSVHNDAWMIDPFYCDFFGYNVTWCVNGFLKRTK